MTKPCFHIVTLGCAKNIVDSESMAVLLGRAGYVISPRAEEADILIVNTCGFIEQARDESLTKLNELVKRKRPGQLLVAAGCLTERFGAGTLREVQGIDGLLSTRRWMDIVLLVKSLRERVHPEPPYSLPGAHTIANDDPGVPRVAIQGASAYLKIADGCRRPCAFCAIPLIKGTAVSRPPGEILQEARLLQERGAREVNLIAQDTTDYGHDLGIKDGLARILEDLVQTAERIDWFRILYAYPGCVTDRLIGVMAEQAQVVPYLDMPLQHAHPGVLQRMRRPSNVDWIYRTIERARSAMPDLALRTTFIVGYPGETEDEFQALLDFVAEIRFDHVGVFTFSFEPGTASEALADPVAPEVKEERRGRLMAMQQGISLEKNKGLIGLSMPVLIEGSGDGLSMGRSARDAPEIDGMVIVEGELPVGEIVSVRVTSALPYDLTAVVEVDEPQVVCI